MEQIRLFYLNLLNKIFYIIIFFLFLIVFYFFLYLNSKKIDIFDNILTIPKGANLSKIVDLVLQDENVLNKNIYLLYLKIYNKYVNKIKFGEYKTDKQINLFKITKLISNPSNYYKDFTIIEGWQHYQLDELIYNLFNESHHIDYNSIFADTYKYQSHNDFLDIIDLMKSNKKNFFIKHSDNELLNQYSINEIMIIGSLVEKEGKNDYDKKLISSVILNRLEKNLKLEIDATTIFSITKGKTKFDRQLTYKDLKINDDYNTYFIKRLPPTPICYIGTKTIEIVLENYISEYLFYFFDKNIGKHIFSKSFKEHKKKLDKYRKKIR